MEVKDKLSLLKDIAKKCYRCSLSGPEIRKCPVNRCGLHPYRSVAKDITCIDVIDDVDLCESVINKCIDCSGGALEKYAPETVFRQCDRDDCHLHKWIEIVIAVAYDRRG